ncbi:hypothetical protein [Brevundimonas sp.]|uniref:hypothetical protein n=1 Tax=Brevundimonas sp. TaxID=1871086 RepID=UPI002FC8CCC0
MGPRCPHCRERILFLKTQWGLGSTFACKACDTRLIVPRSQSAGITLSMFTAFWIFRNHFPVEWGGQLGLFLVFCIIGLPTVWALTSAKLAPETTKEKPPEI